VESSHGSRLLELRQIWRGTEIGPFPAAAPTILIGGFAPAALRRVARHADDPGQIEELAAVARLAE
jgi:hypothetical protein